MRLVRALRCRQVESRHLSAWVSVDWRTWMLGVVLDTANEGVDFALRLGPFFAGIGVR